MTWKFPEQCLFGLIPLTSHILPLPLVNGLLHSHSFIHYLCLQLILHILVHALF